MKRPDKRTVAAYLAALVRYAGKPPAAIWRRYSLRTRAAAIFPYRNGGKQAPLGNPPETDEARRLPKGGDL